MRMGPDAVREDTGSKPSGDRKKSEKTNYFTWKDKDSMFLRFLTDGNEIILADTYRFVPGKNGDRNAISRTEFGLPDPWADNPPQGRYGDIKPMELGYAVAVLREPHFEVIDGVNRQVGMKDVLDTDEDGKVFPVTGFVIESTYYLFNSIFGLYNKYGSLLEYDVEISLKGSGKNKQYTVLPELPPENVKDAKGNDVPTDKLKARYANYTPDQFGYVRAMASARWYETNFGLTVPALPDEKSNKGESSEESDNTTVGSQSELDQIEAKQAALAEEQGVESMLEPLLIVTLSTIALAAALAFALYKVVMKVLDKQGGNRFGFAADELGDFDLEPEDQETLG